MTLSPANLLLYAGAVFILFLTPGPVWMAITARIRGFLSSPTTLRNTNIVSGVLLITVGLILPFT